MASTRPKDPNGFPPWFVNIFQTLPQRLGCDVYLGTFQSGNAYGAEDLQRLVRQYRRSLRKFPLHPHARIERDHKIVCSIQRGEFTGIYTVTIRAEVRKPDPVTEDLQKWLRG